MSSDLARRPLHVVFFPLMATGHMSPMVDMANLFASRRGVAATVITTPANAPLVVSRRLPGAAVSLRILPFPSPALTGLPHGVENIKDLSDLNSNNSFFTAMTRLREPFRRLLRELHPVDAVVTDNLFPWTLADAEELGIPRIVFHGFSFFSLCANSAAAAAPLDGGDTVVLGGLPHRVEMLRSQMFDVSQGPPRFRKLLEEIAATEGRSYGTVVNSFYELEPDYVRHFREAMGYRAWHVGPVALHNQDGALQKRLRRQKENEDEEVQEQERAPEPRDVNGSGSGRIFKNPNPNPTIKPEIRTRTRTRRILKIHIQIRIRPKIRNPNPNPNPTDFKNPYPNPNPTKNSKPEPEPEPENPILNP